MLQQSLTLFSTLLLASTILASSTTADDTLSADDTFATPSITVPLPSLTIPSISSIPSISDPEFSGVPTDAAGFPNIIDETCETTCEAVKSTCTKSGSFTDQVKCMCTNQDFLNKYAQCVSKNCPQRDQQNNVTEVLSLACSAVGITLDKAAFNKDMGNVAGLLRPSLALIATFGGLAVGAFVGLR